MPMLSLLDQKSRHDKAWGRLAGILWHQKNESNISPFSLYHRGVLESNSIQWGQVLGYFHRGQQQVRVSHNRQHPGPTQWCLRHNRWHPEEGCTELSRHYLHVPSRTALEGPWCGPGDQQATQGCPHRGTTAPSLPQGPASQHHFCTGWASAKENLNSFQKQF